ncbi:MAG: 23S rRNA (pseudouridine(1915)-N(3))-methyltransferase RlmH [Erysipelotrichaceae bacterium]
MIRIYCVGRIKEVWMQQQIDSYLKEIRKHHEIEIIEIKDLECPSHYSLAQQEQVKQAECALLEAKMRDQEVLIALDLHGKMWKTPELLAKVKSVEHVGFIIGGSLGISDALLKKAKWNVKMSEMTFTHLFARMMLLEQLTHL